MVMSPSKLTAGKHQTLVPRWLNYVIHCLATVGDVGQTIKKRCCKEYCLMVLTPGHGWEGQVDSGGDLIPDAVTCERVIFWG